MVRWFETLKTKFQKVSLGTKFIRTCKREGLIPTFANVQLSVRDSSNK